MRRITRWRALGTAAVVAAAAAALVAATAPPAQAGILVTPGGVRFTHFAPDARSVSLAGTFNDWSTTANPMAREEDGTWSVVLRLAPGTHEYKFVADGQWIADPDNPVTMGDYGNSAFRLDDAGRLAEMESVSNTPYSAKIRMEGRTIGTYRSRKNPANGDRFELRRPSLDVDLGFGVRVNDEMDAYILTNIHSEAENIELYRTRLNFDRGRLDYRSEGFSLRAWDHFDVGTWEDPMHLVGDIGIYEHPFGLGTQGATARHAFGPVDVRVLYADRFEDGGQGTPAYDPFFDLILGSGTADDVTWWAYDEADGRMRFTPRVVRSYRFLATANDEDVLAARVTGRVGPVDLGASGRLDRGYNPGSFGFLSALRDTTVTAIRFLNGVPVDTLDVPTVLATRTLYPRGTEQWKAAGVDAAWKDAVLGADLAIEGLWGRAEYVGRSGSRDDVLLATLPDSLPDIEEPVGVFGSLDEEFRPIGDEAFLLDESWRVHVAASGLPVPWGVRAGGSVEVEVHDLEPEATGLSDAISNRAWKYRADVAGDVSAWGRRVELALGLEAWDFRYDRRAPWDTQLWFDRRNFWLENGEHVVEYERLLLLGGEDAVTWRPRVAVDVLGSPAVRFEYDGIVAAAGFDREPKYVQTLLRGSWRVRPRWTFGTDLRFVKYNDPVLDLDESFNETFVELKHVVAEGIEVALSYGVDPWVLDEPVNEYAYIGRDLFLFERGANAETARTNYLGLGNRILAAESALANARVLQLEAIVRF